MALPYEHVNYDFDAADRLSWALAVANDRLRSVAGLRATQRSHLLGEPGSDNWSGMRRTTFEARFHPQQHALHALAENMTRLKRAVDEATRQARATNTRTH